MSVTVDGRAELLVTERSTIRVACPARARGVVLQGASSPDLLSAPDVWNVFIEPEANWVEVAMPSSGDVIWRIVKDGQSEDDVPVSVIRRAPHRLGPFLTHPDWSESERPSGSYRFATSYASVPGERVRLFVAVAGVLSVTVNGAEVEPVLAPGVAEFRREVPATAFDLTSYTALDRANDLAIEIAAGPAWVQETTQRYAKLTYQGAPLAFSAQLVLGVGEDARVASADETWTTCRGSSISTNWYGGEDFATAEAEVVSPVVLNEPAMNLWWPENPGARIVESLAPVAVSDLPNGARVFDFGRNVAGRPRIAFPTSTSERGSVEVWPAELTDDDGRITQWSTGTPIFHTVVAGPVESWSPRFMYNGFRYLQVEARDRALPESDEVYADVIRVANESAGSFVSGSSFVSALHELVVRAVEGNMHSMFTDCPHREKLGWLEQMHLCFTALARNYDVEAHVRDALHHMRVAQLPSGAIPSTTPDFVDFSGIEFRGDQDAFRHDPNWGRAIVSTAWKHYRYYGDRRVLFENVDAIDRYLDYLESRSTDDLLDFGLGDWIALEHTTSRMLVSSYGFQAALRDAANVHAALGDEEREKILRARAETVRSAILQRFTDKAGFTQAELALLLDLADDADQPILFECLLKRISSDGRLTVGEIGLPAVVAAFSRAGQDRQLLEIISQPDMPGYGLQVARGATSLTENWTVVSGPEGEGSQNHFMLGMVDDWILEIVGGLRQQRDSVAWSVAEIRPLLDREIGSAAVSYRSIRGEWSVAWNASEAWLEVTVPVSGRAELSLPDGWSFSDTGGAEKSQGPGQVRHPLRASHEPEVEEVAA